MKNHEENKLKKFASCLEAHSRSRMLMSITHCVFVPLSVGNLIIRLGTIIQEISKTSMLLNLLSMLVWCSDFFNEATVKVKYFCLKTISEDSQRFVFI